MVVVSVLLTLLGLTGGMIIGVVLGRRAQEGKGNLQQRHGESHERSDAIDECVHSVETGDLPGLEPQEQRGGAPLPEGQPGEVMHHLVQPVCVHVCVCVCLCVCVRVCVRASVCVHRLL